MILLTGKISQESEDLPLVKIISAEATSLRNLLKNIKKIANCAQMTEDI